MNTFGTIHATRQFIESAKKAGKSIGFVPTMGALHEGHLTLMRRAKKENDLLAVSVFVNPIQFNNPEDLKKYPRDLEKDKALLESVGCDILFAPSADEMYPEEKVTEQFNFGKLETVMEGAFRPGHFNGVAVVVKRLFNIITPDKAYFGKKDFQQLAIIKRLVKMEKMPLTIVPCAIVREPDGLAMSSRNERLKPEERAVAPLIHQILQEAVQLKDKKSPLEITRWVADRFNSNPSFTIEYFQIADDTFLQPVNQWERNTGAVGFVAAFLGDVRLIDNIQFY